MKFAILSLAAAGALAVSSGTASAQPGHFHGGHNHGGGYNSGFHPIGPHLDYHRGHYHLHDGYYRSAPLVPVVPTYSYPNYGYNSGFGLTINRPGLSFSFGSGRATPLYVQPSYGGGYYGGRRW